MFYTYTANDSTSFTCSQEPWVESFFSFPTFQRNVKISVEKPVTKSPHQDILNLGHGGSALPVLTFRLLSKTCLCSWNRKGIVWMSNADYAHVFSPGLKNSSIYIFFYSPKDLACVLCSLIIVQNKSKKYLHSKFSLIITFFTAAWRNLW